MTNYPIRLRAATSSHHPRVDFDPFLSAGGRVIYLRTRRPPSTCNLLATIAGLDGREAQ